jgi:hypothetical protein
MKNLRTQVLCLFAMLFSLCSFAQSEKDPINQQDLNKPKLFSNLPDRIPVSIEKINDLLNALVGNSTSLKVNESSSFQFDGEVVSKATKYDNRIQSVIIRSTNFNGAGLPFLKSPKKMAALLIPEELSAFSMATFMNYKIRVDNLPW